MNKFLRVFLAILISFVALMPAYAQSGIYIRPDSSTLPTPITFQTWLFNSSNGQVYVWNGSAFSALTPPSSNFVATTNPTTANDNTQGYAPGSLWLNTTAHNFWLCTNAASSAAVWDLVASDAYNASVIPTLLKTGLSTGDFAQSTVVPSVPGSGLITTLPGGSAYVNGTLVNVPAGGSHTYSNNSWTYDFITSSGTYSHFTQSPSTSPPTVSNAVLAYLVKTSSGNITAIVPYYAGGGLNLLRNFMLTPPGSVLALVSDPTQPLGQAYETLPIGALSVAGGAANQLLGINGSNTGYEFKTLTAGSNIVITPSSGALTITGTTPPGFLPQCGRLTTVSGGPYTDGTASTSGDPTIYFTPCQDVGNSIALWDTVSSTEIVQPFSEVSFAATGLSGAYDVEIHSTGSNTVAITVTPWSSNVTPPTRDIQDGRYVKHSTPDHLIVGSIFVGSGPNFSNWTGERWVYNMYNQAELVAQSKISSVDFWAPSNTGAWHPANSNVTDGQGRISFFEGEPKHGFSPILTQVMQGNTSPGAGIGFSIDSVGSAANPDFGTVANLTGSQYLPLTASGTYTPLTGLHFLQYLEWGAGQDSFGLRVGVLTNPIQSNYLQFSLRQ